MPWFEKCNYIISGQLGQKGITRSHLKNRILVHGRGGDKFQTAGILEYFEDWKRGTNIDIGPKDIFEIASNNISLLSGGKSTMAAVSRMTRRITFSIFLLVAFTSLFFTAVAQAKTPKDTFIVFGTGLVQKENLSAARQEAISNSLVTAVGLTMAELLPVESLVAHHEALNEILYGHTRKFIRDYKVLTESMTENVYRVMVQATVSGKSIKTELSRAGIMHGKKTMPSILFFIAEQSLRDVSPRYWWGRGMTFVKPPSELAMAEALREKGFQIIEHGPRVQNIAFGTVEDTPDLNNPEAIELGVNLNADVVVLGRAIASSAPNTMGGDIKSFKGMITAWALRTKTGKEITSVTRTALTANVDEIAGSRDALSGAGSLLAEDLASQIIAAWQREDLELTTVEILLHGTRNFVNFVSFRRMLSNINGVESIQVKELKTDNATINVNYKGKSKELADALMLNPFETFGINIYEVSQEHLKIELIPNKP
jgi:hypothetical protein